MKLFNRKPSLITRKELDKLPLASIVEFYEFTYNMDRLPAKLLQYNKLNQYLLKHNKYIAENQLEDILEEYEIIKEENND